MRILLTAALRRLATWLRVRRARAITSFGTDLHIGVGCRFWAAKGITIGNGCYVGKNVTIETNAQIGNYVLFANEVALVGRHDHDYKRVGVPVRFGTWVGGGDAAPEVSSAGVIVEDDVWLGFRSTVLSGVRVGRGAIVAAGSLVVSDVQPYDIVGGVPARVLGRRFESASEISRHEHLVRLGVFRSSERGYGHWVVRPGE